MLSMKGDDIMIRVKEVEENCKRWYDNTVQVFERSYRTDADFVMSHIKSGQNKFACTGYLLSGTREKPLKALLGECKTIEQQMQNNKIPYSQLVTVQNNKSLQTAYIVYASDKKKLNEILSDYDLTALDNIDSFMSSYEKVMILVASNISQRHVFDRSGIW